MPRLTDDLKALHSGLIAKWGNEGHRAVAAAGRRRTLTRLEKQGIVTVADLLERFAALTTRLKLSAIDLIALLELRQAVPVLLEAVSDRHVRLGAADVLGRLGPTRKTERFFLTIGRRQLQSEHPDPEWLDACIHALGISDDPQAAELLVTIFERVDLPGWLRGNAGDKLGINQFVYDRRSRAYRRCRDAALRGISEDSVDVRFWSLYVIASLCNSRGEGRTSAAPDFEAALPALERIAASDHRLAPGLWWPISAEAEDAIGCIRNGVWPDPDAGDRWQSVLPKRGRMSR